MIREKIDAQRERQILTLAITNTEFLRGIYPMAKLEQFKTSYARTVYSWIAQYFKEFSIAPQKDIQELYITHKLELDEDEEVIAQFLKSLSDDSEEPNNIPFRIKEAEEWFAFRAIEMLEDTLRECLVRKDRESAEEAIANYIKIARVESDDIDVLTDVNSAVTAFTDESEILFQFPGPLGAVIGQFKRTDFVAFMAPMKRGKCVTGDTQVLLQDGRMERIDNLVSSRGGAVVAINDATKIVEASISDFWSNGKKPVYEITTRSGRKVKATNNHPLLSFERGWISKEDGLAVGDYIAVPRNIPIFGDKTMEESYVRLIAYLIADGGLTTNSIVYTKKDLFMKNDVINIVEELGDICTKVGKYGVRITKKYNGPQKTETALLLGNYGVPRVLSGEKTIPTIIFQLKRDLISLFLRTLFSGDGSIHKGGVDYSSASEEMINQISHLLLRFGIVGRIRSKVVRGSTYWEYQIRDSHYVRRFLDEIGFVGEKKKKVGAIYSYFEQKKSKSYLDAIPGSYRKVLIDKMRKAPYHPIYDTILEVPNVSWNISRSYLERANTLLNDPEVANLLSSNVMWDPIESIIFCGEEYTYDITVPVYHNFIANDICLHNSSWLWESAQQALFSGCKVLFISLEMPKNQMLRRIWMSLTRKPKTSRVVRMPSFVEMDELRDGKPMWKVEYEDVGVEALEPTNGFFTEWKAKFRKYFHRGDIKLKCIPAKTATVQDIMVLLNNLEFYQNWVPDVVVLDYADLLSSRVQGEERHRLDDIWSNLRRVALQKEVCIISATQSNRAGIHEDLDMEHAAEDIRKVAHVTKMIGINATKDEKANGLFRINQIAERDDEAVFEQAYVTSCLSIGSVFLDSRYRSEVWVDKGKRVEGA